MPFLRNVSNDIFISYRYADNASDVAGRRWVSDFTSQLETAVKQRLGGPSDFKVYFDRRDAQSNYDLDRLLSEVRTSAIFIAIASRAYAEDSWALRELQAFTTSDHHKDSLFVVEILPLDPNETYPNEALESRTRLRFWKDIEESRTPMMLSLPEDITIYRQLINRLAEQIRKQLLKLKHEDEGGPRVAATTQAPATAVVSPKDPRRSRQSERGTEVTGAVLLAQTTDDLFAEREQVRSYLEQAGVVVYPDGEYPQGGDSFRSAFNQDLKRVDLLVHLLSAAPGRRPADLVEGYTAYQAKAAQAAGTPTLRWRHPGLHPESVRDDAHRALLSSDVTIASGLERFKSEIRERLVRREAPKTTRPRSFVYVDVDLVDLAIAQSIREELSRRQIPVMLPIFEGSATDLTADLEENMIESDTLIFVYASAPVNWIRGHLRRYSRTIHKRAAPPIMVALYLGPPPGKADIAADLPFLRIVKCEQSLDLEPLLALLER